MMSLLFLIKKVYHVFAHLNILMLASVQRFDVLDDVIIRCVLHPIIVFHHFPILIDKEKQGLMNHLVFIFRFFTMVLKLFIANFSISDCEYPVRKSQFLKDNG